MPSKFIHSGMKPNVKNEIKYTSNKFINGKLIFLSEMSFIEANHLCLSQQNSIDTSKNV